MKVAKVVGNIWATRKDERLSGMKLLVVQPVNMENLESGSETFVAADMIGAGIGETVLLVSGSSARSAVNDMNIPVDATIVGIVDNLEVTH